MKFLGGREPWQDITKNLTRRKGVVKAAISYLGPEAPRIMHLKAGDLLVCDASESAIRAGSTQPHALTARWFHLVKQGGAHENIHTAS